MKRAVNHRRKTGRVGRVGSAAGRTRRSGRRSTTTRRKPTRRKIALRPRKPASRETIIRRGAASARSRKRARLKRLGRRTVQPPVQSKRSDRLDTSIAIWAGALGHPVRLKLLRHLRRCASAGYVELCRAGGQTGGPLYHHVHALERATFIARSGRDVYALTASGRRAFDGWLRLAGVLSRITRS